LLDWLFGRLYRRVAVGYVLLLALVLGALGVYLASYLRQEQLASLEARLHHEALMVADYAQYRLATGGPTNLDQLAKDLGRESGVRITLIATDGTVWGDSEHAPSTMDNHLTRPEVQQALRFGTGQTQRYSTTLEESLLYVAVPLQSSAAVLGVARVALPIRQIDASIQRLVLSVLSALGLASLLAIGLALLLARVTTARIEAVTAAARRLAAGELNQSVPQQGADEVAWLARAFNEMASNLRTHILALDTERARLDAILIHMADGVLILDERGLVQTINPAAARLLQVAPAQAIGRSLMAVVRDHEVATVVAEIQTTEQPVVPRVIEMGPPADRRYVQVAATGVPAAEGIPSRVLVILQDVSELRRAEVVRREFVANVSHELRTPVASLKALVETLEDGALEDPSVSRDFLGRMHVEVDGLAKLIEELLQLARMESGRAMLNLQTVNLVQVVQEATDRLRPTAERSGIHLKVTFPADLPPVRSDPDRLREVIGNLVHNAIKFSRPGQEVRIGARPLNREVAVSIEDDGVGIPPEALGRLFERFYQADPSRAAAGTGLGLAIAKHVVQLHGGSIWAESEGEGRGARFTFTVPRADS
jgi:two-component system, OmpR family, phosphate regulon sensor histidine kinase PhoR